MSTLGSRIREIRGTSSQQDFADKLSITRQYVALLESDKRDPSPLLVDSLCQKFGIRREWLIFGDLPKYAQDTPAEDAALASVISAMAGQSENKKRLLHIIAEMPDDLLEAFCKYLDTKKPPEA